MLNPIHNQSKCMKATIYHNPQCSKSRNILAILQDKEGVEVEVIAYLKNPPSAEKLADLYKKANMHPKEGVRTSGTNAVAMGLTADDVPAETVIEAMAQNPKYIERPLVETEKGVRLCRPVERVEEIL